MAPYELILATAGQVRYGQPLIMQTPTHLLCPRLRAEVGRIPTPICSLRRLTTTVGRQVKAVPVSAVVETTTTRVFAESRVSPRPRLQGSAKDISREVLVFTAIDVHSEVVRGHRRMAKKGTRVHGRTNAVNCSAAPTSITNANGPFQNVATCAEAI